MAPGDASRSGHKRSAAAAAAGSRQAASEERSRTAASRLSVSVRQTNSRAPRLRRWCCCVTLRMAARHQQQPSRRPENHPPARCAAAAATPQPPLMLLDDRRPASEREHAAASTMSGLFSCFGRSRALGMLGDQGRGAVRQMQVPACPPERAGGRRSGSQHAARARPYHQRGARPMAFCAPGFHPAASRRQPAVLPWAALGGARASSSGRRPRRVPGACMGALGGRATGEGMTSCPAPPVPSRERDRGIRDRPDAFRFACDIPGGPRRRRRRAVRAHTCVSKGSREDRRGGPAHTRLSLDDPPQCLSLRCPGALTLGEVTA